MGGGRRRGDAWHRTPRRPGAQGAPCERPTALGSTRGASWTELTTLRGGGAAAWRLRLGDDGEPSISTANMTQLAPRERRRASHHAPTAAPRCPHAPRASAKVPHGRRCSVAAARTLQASHGVAGGEVLGAALVGGGGGQGGEWTQRRKVLWSVRAGVSWLSTTIEGGGLGRITPWRASWPR